MQRVVNLVAYSRECDADDSDDVFASFKQTRQTETYYNSRAFDGFCMLPGVAENATDAECEILDKSLPGGPALGKLVKLANSDTIYKQKTAAARKLRRAQEFCDKRVMEYNQRLLAKSAQGHTQCVTCKSKISNSQIYKCLAHNKCSVCDGKFQNYTNTENYFNPIKEAYEDIPHPYKAVWGGWI